MSTLFLTPKSKNPGEHNDYPRVRIEQSYHHDAHKAHQLVQDPEKADIILFATNHHFLPIGICTSLWDEPLYQRFPEKSVLYDSYDFPSPLTGGLCSSWEKRLETSPGTGIGWCYFHPTSAEPTLQEQEWPAEPKYLWSFKGSKSTHTVRDKLFDLEDSSAYLDDTSKISINNLRKKSSDTDEEKVKFLNDYVDLLRNSSFIACPRGVGASSMRIYEAMRAGRAPVIISDKWLPPPFVAWETCSLRIPENQVHALPTILRERATEAKTLGRNARLEWERVFGDRGLFHHTVEACLLVLNARSEATKLQKIGKYLKLLQPPYPRLLLSYYKNSAKRIVSKKI